MPDWLDKIAYVIGYSVMGGMAAGVVLWLFLGAPRTDNVQPPGWGDE